jgi:hypothetical protein
VIELAVVAAGFALRAIAGGAATHVPLSSWFLAVTSFGALFVVTGKRAAEYATLGEHGHSHRAVLAQYTSSFLQSTLTLTSSVTVTTYCLWAFDKAGPATRAGHRFVWIQLTVVPMILGVLWVLRLLDSGQGAGGFSALRPRPAGFRSGVARAVFDRTLRVNGGAGITTFPAGESARFHRDSSVWEHPRPRSNEPERGLMPATTTAVTTTQSNWR